MVILIELVLGGVAAVAALISVKAACSTKKMQHDLAANKDDINRVNQLIEQLKVAQAILNHPNAFIDKDFMSGINLESVQSSIAILKQNTKLCDAIAEINWEGDAMQDIATKVEVLEKCRDLLF